MTNDTQEITPPTLDNMRAACEDRLMMLHSFGVDLTPITSFIEELSRRYVNESARRQYLEGYSETLFKQVIVLETKG